MKNSLQLLALGLVLFLGACSNGEPNGDKDTVTPPTIETKFLDKVANKTAYDNATTQDETTKIGTFNANGKTFTFADPGNPVFTFVTATDENKGEYVLDTIPIPVLLTFTTSDGITGSTSSKNGSPTELWFK